MAVPAAVVTGPERGLVGGQSRHLEILARISEHLGYRFRHVEIGQRRGEVGRGRMLRRMVSDYRTFAHILRLEIEGSDRVVAHVNSSIQFESLVRDFGFVLIARFLRANIVLVQYHGSNLRSAESRQPVLRALARLLVRSAGRGVMLSQVQVVALRGRDLPITVVSNAIEVQETLVFDQEQRPRVRLLYLARMVPAKGVLICLEAARLLADRRFEFELIIAGDGPLLETLPLRITELGLEPLVRLLGPIPAQSVRPLLQQADLLWAPSVYAEGQPYALIEALEAGLPVLATVANPAMREMIEDSDGAILPVPAQPEQLAALTEKIVNTSGELSRLRTLARAAARSRYSLEAAIPRWRSAWSSSGNALSPDGASARA